MCLAQVPLLGGWRGALVRRQGLLGDGNGGWWQYFTLAAARQHPGSPLEWTHCRPPGYTLIQDQSAPGEASLAFAQRDSGWKFPGPSVSARCWSCSPIGCLDLLISMAGVFPLTCFPLTSTGAFPEIFSDSLDGTLGCHHQSCHFAFVRLVLPAPLKSKL